MGTFIKGFKIGNVVKKYFVDDTLTEAEYPPSAKKVGDEISELDGQITDLKSDLNVVNDLLSFLDVKREIQNTHAGHNIITTGLSLKTGKTYTARWTLSEAISVKAYAYLTDTNDQNIYSGSTTIEAGTTVFEKTIKPSQDYDNITAKVWLPGSAPSISCAFELYSNDNSFTRLEEKFNNISISAFSELKNVLPFIVGSLTDGVPAPGYKYRISSPINLVFDSDITVKLTDGYRGGYCVFQNIEDTTTTTWVGWNSTLNIPANTIFKLQLARQNNQETTGGTISDPYDNDIMEHLTIYATKAESYDFSSVEYGHRGLKCESFMSYSLWPQGVARVEDTLVGFMASNDDHTNTAKYTSMYFRDGYRYNARGNHNLGHCASADYCKETDALIVANGTYAEGVVPTVYLINNAKSKTDEGADILVTDSDVIDFDLSSLTGDGCIACFGETSDIMYVMTAEDALHYSQYGGKYLYKMFLGKGSADMTTLHPNESVGTFISGKSDNEYNGTAYIIKEYYGEYFIELQGMKYVNGRIVISCDKQVDGVLTAFIMLLKANDKRAIIEADNIYWIPSLDSNGAYVKTESEGVAFDGGYGYVTIFRSTLNDSETLKFSLFD